MEDSIFGKDARFFITGNGWYIKREGLPDIERFEQFCVWIPEKTHATKFTLYEVELAVNFLRTHYGNEVTIKAEEALNDK